MDPKFMLLAQTKKLQNAGLQLVKLLRLLNSHKNSMSFIILVLL